MRSRRLRVFGNRNIAPEHAGKAITVKVTGKKAGYKTVSKVSKKVKVAATI